MNKSQCIAAFLLALLPLTSQSSVQLSDRQQKQVHDFVVGVGAVRFAAKSCPGWTPEIKKKVEPFIAHGKRDIVARGIPESAIDSEMANGVATVSEAVKERGAGWVCTEVGEDIKKEVMQFKMP